MAHFTRDETSVIAAHKKHTTCFVLADTGTCLDLQAEEIRRVTGRLLVPVTSQSLPTSLPSSWFMAVVLCPGDSTPVIAKWASKLNPADQQRIAFYEPLALPNPQGVYAAWLKAGLPDPIRSPVADPSELNRLMGLDLNRRILKDHRGP